MRGPWFLTAARDVSYTHDQRGNLTYDGTFTYTYNAAGRLVQAESITNTVVYTYNGNGVRVATAVDGIETRYVQDISIGLEQVLVETTGENVTLYTYGIARLAQVQGSAFEWFLGDALGSVRQVVDNSGDVLLAQGYTPFGLVHSESGTGSSGYGFTGEQADPTGLVYLRARYYDPRLGRFVGVDLFPGYAELPATLHGYLYCLNNPVNAVDPGGLQGEPWWARAVNPEYNPITATVVRRFAEGGLAWAGISDLYRTSVQYTASALREGRWDDYMRGTMGVARMNVTLAGAALFTAGSAIVGYYTTPIRLAVVDIPLWIKSGSEWLQGKGREWDVALTSLTLGLDAWGTYKMASCPRTSVQQSSTIPPGPSGGDFQQRLQQVSTKIPPEWGPGKPNNKGVGWRWLDPQNPAGEGVRIDQGNPLSTYPSQRVDHVVVRYNGVVRNRQGAPVPGGVASDPLNTHIPLDEWLTWKTWFSPD
jgi:RHS repeat-associated protein